MSQSADNHRWRNKEVFLLLMIAASPIAFSIWQSQINNFAVEAGGFDGRRMGILHSLREVPGFLAFGVVFALLLVREQALAILALGLLGIGVGITGWFPSHMGLYATTVIGSVGFHVFETLHHSLSLQWFAKSNAPELIGRQTAVYSLSALAATGLAWLLLAWGGYSMRTVFAVGGGLACLMALFLWVAFPRFESPHQQHTHLVLRKRYWLYYALTFMSGARRQIFVVFAGFLMVERFGFRVTDTVALLCVNHVIKLWLAPRIGRWIMRYGERRALISEYSGLTLVFCAYAFADSAWFAACLFLIDHLFFALAIAHKTYLQKIADPRDLASTAGVAFTINHIAAVILPVLYGQLWMVAPHWVFLSGAGMALISLALACNVPRHPAPGAEVLRGYAGQLDSGPST